MLSDTQLNEADLLGKPATASIPTPPATSSPEPGHESLEGGSTPIASERPPGQLDDQMKKTLALAIELRRALTKLPHPWNKQFHRYSEVLQSLTIKLKEIS